MLVRMLQGDVNNHDCGVNADQAIIASMRLVARASWLSKWVVAISGDVGHHVTAVSR